MSNALQSALSDPVVLGKAVWVLVVAVATWGLVRFVRSVDDLVADQGRLHDRMTAIEVQLGIIPERRAPPRRGILARKRS